MNADLSDIRRDFTRVSADVARRAGKFQAAILADVAGRPGPLNGRLPPVAPEVKFAGPALPIEVPPGPNPQTPTPQTMAQPRARAALRPT